MMEKKQLCETPRAFISCRGKTNDLKCKLTGGSQRTEGSYDVRKGQNDIKWGQRYEQRGRINQVSRPFKSMVRSLNFI